VADSVTYNDAFKILYTDEDVVDAMIGDEDCPFLGMIEKDTTLEGIEIRHPIEIAKNQSTGPDYAVVHAHDGSSKWDQWVWDAKEWYGEANWTLKSVLQSKSKKGAFKSIVTNEMDGTLTTMRQDIEIMAFGPIGGYRGVIAAASVLASDTIILTNRWDALKFFPDMELSVNDNDGTGVSVDRAMVGTPKVVSSDPIAGTVKLSANWDASFGGIAAGDYIFKRGSFGKNWTSLNAWMPASVTGTLFKGVDRSASPIALGGFTYTATSSSVKEAMLAAIFEGSGYGCKPKVGFMHHVRMGELVQELEAESNRPRDVVGKSNGGTAEFGFAGVRLNGPKGPIDIYPATFCGYYDTWLLNMAKWKLRSMGPVPKIFDEDGNRFLRKAGAMGFESRVYAWGDFCCSLPGSGIHVVHPS
jgi:hypothetical protein